MFGRSSPPRIHFINEAAAGPGSGHEVPLDQIRKPEEVDWDDPNIRVVELPPQRKPSFKERVYGYARVIRGSALADPNVKEQGERVLRGEETIPRRRGSASD
ncbi:hypothetical protein M404DRAFT_25541 [Pisolithus tinctorius Marx 270]|uniref:Uncharacterized protein n=1 Tax=Pisolithus tinctorius Marx 270 TaxID=870435 RepID=A0A0C3J8Q5_PISTI|nr:hypothetical protein M404DRAFT_25541 [Pisolithus tinctorius Marx 270]